MGGLQCCWGLFSSQFSCLKLQAGWEPAHCDGQRRSDAGVLHKNDGSGAACGHLGLLIFYPKSDRLAHLVTGMARDCVRCIRRHKPLLCRDLRAQSLWSLAEDRRGAEAGRAGWAGWAGRSFLQR